MDLLNISENNRKAQQPLYYTFIGMLSVMRGYNILIVVIAQYLASIFIFKPNESLKSILLDGHLFITVLATSLVIAAGYIINNFYDAEVDRINKPLKTSIDNFVSQKSKLRIYFLLNFLGFFLGFVVSWKAALFFAIYIFLIWFYSHKLKKKPFLGLLGATSLAMLPFFVIFVYHKNISEIIFTHAAFLFCMILIRELVKDLENVKGAFIYEYQTIPVKYGPEFSKVIIALFVFLAMNPIYFLWKYPEIGMMRYYFYFVFVSLLVFLVLLWKAKSQANYNVLHNILKILIVIGVFSLSLIDTSVIISRILERL
ncbi:geranylgeranylglycerol-phosphate geranylgeranyltransferase [Flavicella sediminum]|uniref:geranylgeranylglycerol-phosphate geranylgeranyltransferase n=1 Tax=Flavicella sediminum TaxID=2585141 RepID=UPI00111F09A3|nr:geranylgeranylglycerol-phosphate geranylgeranyltransferase [Flavicella sediminum]